MPSKPLPRRYLARRGRDAQALLPTPSDLRDLCVGLWSGLGPPQGHNSRVLSPSKSATASPIYACPPLVHLGRPRAQAVTSRERQDGLDLSEVGAVPVSITRLQSAHQAVSRRCPRAA